MKPLPLNKALELYDILHEHLPEFDENAEPLEFIGKIIKSIRSSEKYRHYVDAVSIMADIPVDELVTHSSDDILQMFIEGLSANKIVSLQIFADKVGYHGR